METKTVNVLLVEDNPDDAILIRDALLRTDRERWDIEWAQTLAEGLGKAASSQADVVLLDLSLPDSHGIDTFLQACAAIPSVPIILLTGLDDEEVAVQAAHQGAQDYLVKGKANSELLARSIKYAIERHRLLADLQQESLAKTMVLSTATHELKTPLTSIVGYVDRLLLRQETVGPLNEKQSRYLETVQNNAYRLKLLVDELLDVSRIESGSLELCLMDLEAGPEIQDVVQSMRYEIKNKHIDLVMDVPKTNCRVMADRLRFSQVVNNLVSNACKYSPDGSSVTISSREYDGVVQIDVSDTGIGISQQDQGLLFTKFFRADNSPTRKVSGSGLGLYITKHLVEAHGGAIWADSQLGVGTTLSFTWPKANSEGSRNASN